MRSLLIFVCLLLVTALCLKCTPKEEETICFEFDQRQCAGDDWFDLVPINDSQEDREAKMLNYLKSIDIEATEVRLVLGFHEFVCEACYSCPETDRFFVKILEEDELKFEELDLLNSGKINCEDAF